MGGGSDYHARDFSAAATLAKQDYETFTRSSVAAYSRATRVSGSGGGHREGGRSLKEAAHTHASSPASPSIRTALQEYLSFEGVQTASAEHRDRGSTKRPDLAHPHHSALTSQPSMSPQDYSHDLRQRQVRASRRKRVLSHGLQSARGWLLSSATSAKSRRCSRVAGCVAPRSGDQGPGMCCTEEPQRVDELVHTRRLRAPS